MEPVEGTTVKWLSRVGDPSITEYGLRLFVIKPGGFIPEHQHQPSLWKEDRILI
jgi:quercetin dioxygenase-like cupin family protein